MTHFLHHLWFTYGWPSDRGNGPEAIQELAVGALLGAVLWPPLRRRIHRAMAHNTAELHRKLDHIIHHHPDIPDLPELPPKEN